MTDIDAVWVLVCGIMVFFMQLGFLCLETGRCRRENAGHIALKNLADLSFVVLLFWLAGAAFMFGDSWNGWIGLGGFSVPLGQNATDSRTLTILFFQVAFVTTAVSIVSGAMAERCRFVAYVLFGGALGVLIYPIIGHAIWGSALIGSQAGWLEEMGFIDFSGGTVVHSTGGWAALAGVLFLGPRLGRFGRPRPGAFQGQSIMFSTMGAVLLWVGWLGFNAGSALRFDQDVPAILLKTILGASSGMIAGMCCSLMTHGHVTAGNLLNGMLAGLVAGTACVHLITGSEAIIVGGIGAVLAQVTGAWLTEHHIDDPVEAISVHLAPGIWGTLAVASFGDPSGLMAGSRLEQAAVQLLGIAYCGAIAFGGSVLALGAIRMLCGLRVPPRAEAMGLDKHEHGVIPPHEQLAEYLYRKSKIDARFQAIEIERKEISGRQP